MRNLPYFQSFTDYFWQWEEDGDVLTIPNYNTLAYRGLVMNLLAELENTGFPSFNAFLLTVIATGHDSENLLYQVEAIFHKNISQTDSTSINNAFDFLKLLSQVPEKYKTGKLKPLLFKAIFKSAHNKLAINKSENALNILRNASQTIGNQEKVALSSFVVQEDLKTLYLLAKKFQSIDQIIYEIVEIPTLEKDLEITGDKGSNRLIDDLQKNTSTQTMAALVPFIWSGIQIPFHSTNASQQPLGGVSDLTNKGNINQLLISEFAYDDLTFMSRIANNESLYLRREAPPSTHQKKRVILIDVSLKNWGTPKTISFATMLAIANHPKTDIICESYLIGNKVYPIQINSVDAIIEALQIIDPCINSRTGLEEYFKHYHSKNNIELFLLSEESIMQQMEMLDVLSSYKSQIQYLMISDFSGSIDLYKNLKNSRKHIQHLELPLSRLQHNKSPQEKNTQRMNIKGYPILFKRPRSYKSILVTENNDIFCFSKRGAILRFNNRLLKTHEMGWDLVSENAFANHNEIGIGVLEDGSYLFLEYNNQERQITLTNLHTQQKKKFHLEHWKNNKLGFIFQNQKFLHQSGNQIWSINPNGEMEESNYTENELRNVSNTNDKWVTQFLSQPGKENGAFWKVTDIGITETDHLIFNVHELMLGTGNFIKLKTQTSKNHVIKAEMIAEGNFEFPDGSTVNMVSSGLIILKSSHSDIPNIYVPSVIGSHLAAATPQVFAGNEFYRKQPLFEVTLKETGNQKLQIIKLLKSKASIALKHAKELVDNVPCKILHLFSEEEAYATQEELEKLGAVAGVSPVDENYKPQETISTQLFFSDYIQPFVDQILSHEASH